MKYHELFRAEKIPVYQNRMFDSERAAVSCHTGAVVLAQDVDTGLVSNVAFDASIVSYDPDYQNEQACSKVFRKHLDEVIRVIDRHLEGKSLLEVGCGKGFFLELLRQHGYNVTGIDPTYQGGSPYVVKALFEPELGLKGEGVVLRHVLEHIPNPLAFLTTISRANGGEGLVYIEVPCFDWICKNRAWFDVFYEHVNYFTLADFYRMFSVVHEAGHLFGDQYLFVVADLASLRKPSFSGLVEFPVDFRRGIDRLIRVCSAIRRRAIWGAAAKGMMLALYLKRAGVGVDAVIDINPAKQGKYMAGSGALVFSPSDGLKLLDDDDEVLVTNSHYMDEIMALSGNRFSYVSVDHNGLC